MVEERYEFVDATGTAAPPRDFTFQMRPWTITELRSRLTHAGFRHIEIQPGIGRRTPDRVLVAARR